MAKSKGKLRIAGGAGPEHEIDLSEAQKYAGSSVTEALAGILSTIQNPQLRQMLGEQRLVLEKRTTTPGGDAEESPLAPNGNWDDILHEIERADADVEIGIAKSHRGGSRRARRKRPRVGDQAFPFQDVVFHPPDYLLTAADRGAAERGTAVFIRGSVIAKEDAIGEMMGGKEFFNYRTGPPGDPTVTDLYLPPQRVSAGYCEVAAKDVIRSAREVRDRGQEVKEANHGHGYLELGPSGVDLGLMEQFNVESVARTSTATRTFRGAAREVAGEDGEAPILEVSFPENNTASVRIMQAGNGHPVAADVDVVLKQTHIRSMACFAVSNARGEHLIPMMESIICPTCGTADHRYIPPKNVTVHVLGPIELSEEEREALADEVSAKVCDVWGWGHKPWRHAQGQSDTSTALTTAGGSTSRLAPFQIYRRGKWVASVPAAVIEEAVANTDALAEALGWK